MNSATYNITDDKLRAHFDERLPAEEYKRARSAGFVYWHGSKLFVAKWTPSAEDFLTSQCITITEDDTPDDIEARVERFQGYAGKAEEGAERSAEYLEERANTERRRENAIRSMEKNAELAEHWQRRIAGAISHAAYKERPDVIARRIEGLERDLRRSVKELAESNKALVSFNDPDYFDYMAKRWPDMDVAKYRAENLTRHANIIEHAGRWKPHLEMRLIYERAGLEAAGGIPSDKLTVEVGGAIRGRGHINRGSWVLITKINKKTIEVYDPSCTWRHFWKVTRAEIKEVMSAEQVKNEAPYLGTVEQALETVRQQQVNEYGQTA